MDDGIVTSFYPIHSFADAIFVKEKQVSVLYNFASA